MLVAVIVMSSTPAWADQAVDNKKLADKLFLEGRQLLDAKDYEGACKKFFAAQEKEKQNVAILLNLGLCYEKQDKRASALKWYLATERIAREKNDPANKEYEDAAKERAIDLGKEVSKVTFSFDAGFPANAEIYLDGDPINKTELIVNVDKGTRIIEARAPGKIPSRKELVVEDNTKSLTYTFEPLVDAPKPKKPGSRRLMGALIGGGVIAAGFTVSYVVGDREEKEVMRSGIKGSLLVADAIWASGLAVGLGIAAYFYFTTPSAKESSATARRTRVTPMVTPESTGVAVFGRF
jgi:hypothetical protein